MDVYYDDAVKLGNREYRSRISRGEFPYLPVLDQILKEADIRTEQKVGLITVPLEFIVGTSTMGRTMSFAANFMPIMSTKSEFAYKWNSLANAQVTEGIRDAIKVYEYLNRYYVVEGNKRVSVMKYFGADAILAEVTRKIPRESDAPEIKRYYEWMQFTDLTDCYSMEFSKSGLAGYILTAAGIQGKWDDKTKEEFNKIQFEFFRAYKFRGGDKLPITAGDAIAVFLNVCGWQSALDMNSRQYSEYLQKIWNEFVALTERHVVDLVMGSGEEPKTTSEKKKILSLFMPGYQKKRLNVAFLYPKSAETSDWIYAHELGRNYLQETFPSEISSYVVNNVTEDKVEAVLEEVIENGADIIFGVAPQMMKPSLTAAIENPQVKILNCSLNTPHQYIRTYYARMYEAKFISGLVAGAMTENDKVAYIADYPLFGMIANINAFALGVGCVNPRAKVYLDWSTRKDFDKDKFLQANDIRYVSDQDMITPNDESRFFGLYFYENGVRKNLVMPVWNWGAFYEKMIRRILAGSYYGNEKAAVNYWWGMSEGVVDVICSKHVPVGVQRLVDHIHGDICGGHWDTFYGEFKDQNGVIRNKAGQSMKPRDIMKMDYLLENIIGTIPDTKQYVDEAKPVIKLKGVEEKTES